jgi:hypothetical protein
MARYSRYIKQKPGENQRDKTKKNQALIRLGSTRPD